MFTRPLANSPGRSNIRSKTMLNIRFKWCVSLNGVNIITWENRIWITLEKSIDPPRNSTVHCHRNWDLEIPVSAKQDLRLQSPATKSAYIYQELGWNLLKLERPQMVMNPWTYLLLSYRKYQRTVNGHIFGWWLSFDFFHTLRLYPKMLLLFLE